MRLLIDTHVAIWWLAGDPRLAPATRATIVSADEVDLSVVSIWEMVIKQGTGRLELPVGFIDALREDFRDLPLTVDHVATARDLPSVHRDPFDRILVAQALTEGLTLVSADPFLPRFGVPVLPA